MLSSDLDRIEATNIRCFFSYEEADQDKTCERKFASKKNNLEQTPRTTVAPRSR